MLICRVYSNSRKQPFHASLFSVTTLLASNLLNYPKADVIERRRLIRAERIIAVALAHNDFLNPMKDRFIVRFLNADSEELRIDVLPENHLVARITFDPVEEGAGRIAEPSLFSELIGNSLNTFLIGSTKLVL